MVQPDRLETSQGPPLVKRPKMANVQQKQGGNEEGQEQGSSSGRRATRVPQLCKQDRKQKVALDLSFRMNKTMATMSSCAASSDFSRLPFPVLRAFVFPHLSLQDISRLRCVSKRWCGVVACMQSFRRAWFFDELMQVCDEPALRYFVRYRRHHVSPRLLQPLFIKYCEFGSLQCVQLIARLAGFTADDVRYEDNCPLRWAASAGKLDVVRFLCEEYSLTLHDVVCSNYYALAQSVINGHVDVAEYLVQRFNIGPSHAGPWLRDVLFESYSNSCMVALQFLQKYFDAGPHGRHSLARLAGAAARNAANTAPGAAVGGGGAGAGGGRGRQRGARDGDGSGGVLRGAHMHGDVEDELLSAENSGSVSPQLSPIPSPPRSPALSSQPRAVTASWRRIPLLNSQGVLR